MDFQAEIKTPVKNLVNKLSVENINDVDCDEESTGSESDYEKGIEVTNTNTVHTLSTIPSLDLSSRPPTTVGSVAITNSENVHFGNKTYFNGHITIKQYVSTKNGIDNASYTKNEDDNVEESESQHKSNSKVKSSVKKITINTWHKILFSIIIIVLFGVICSVAFTLYAKSLQSDDTGNNSDLHFNKQNNEKKMVEVFNIEIIIVLTLVVALVSVLYLLLTNIGVENRYLYEDRKTTTNNNIKGPTQILPPSRVLRFVQRNDWLAQPVEKPLDPINHPVPWVIIAHTATESCHIQSECVLRVRVIQGYHIESRGWYDIGYNFLVGGDGSVYVGRGWDSIGAHTLGYNDKSFGIAFIGTFNNDEPPQQQVEACLRLIELGVTSGKLSADYKVFAHRQLMSTLSPGDKIYKLMTHWPHFASNVNAIAIKSKD